MAKLPSFQFYPGDWLRDPQLRMASPASRGIWIDLLCRAWDAPIRGVIVGTADQLQRLASCGEHDFSAFLEEIEALKFGDLSRESNGLIRIVNRRMVRDEKATGFREKVNRAALSHYPALLRHWFPAGRVVGGEFLVDILDGGPARHLRVDTSSGQWHVVAGPVGAR